MLIAVPTGTPAGFTPINSPPANSIRVPCSSSAARVSSVSRDTAAIEGSASPRNPSVAIESKSSAVRSFDVACRSNASSASSCGIPLPSSVTRISRFPPDSTSTRTDFAPASSEFSTNSFTTDAGRSTTSPAAILFATFSGSIRIRLIIRPSKTPTGQILSPTRARAPKAPAYRPCVLFASSSRHAGHQKRVSAGQVSVPASDQRQRRRRTRGISRQIGLGRRKAKLWRLHTAPFYCLGYDSTSTSRGGIATSVCQPLCSGRGRLFLGLNLNSQLVELVVVDVARRLGHQILRRCGLRERNHFANRFFAREQRHHSVDAQRDAAMRRRTVSQRVEKKSESLPRRLIRKPQRLEHARLHILTMNSNAA